MKRFLISLVICLCAPPLPLGKLGAVSEAEPLVPQKHAAPLAGVPQTPAKNLSEELGEGKKVLVIDVRSAKEFAAGHVPGARSIPLEDLSRKIAQMKISRDTAIVTVCDRGGRSSRAATELRELGYKTSSFCTLDSWKKEGLNLEKGEEKEPAQPIVYKFLCRHSCQTDRQTSNLDQICDCVCGRPYHDCVLGE